MQKKRRSIREYKSMLQVIGVLIALLLAAALLLHGEANSYQAGSALVAQVYFEGTYRIGDGQPQPIIPGKHIPANQGDVILRGYFHILAPDGEYVGVYSGGIPIAFYTNHIGLTFLEEGQEPVSIEMENPLYGISSCGATWTAYTFVGEGEDQIEILIHNPHSFGNEDAIDEMLENLAFWSGMDLEKGVLQKDSVQRNAGLFFAIVSLAILGIAMFSTLIHLKNSRIFWLFGMVILFAGVYISYRTDSVSFWSESVAFNTSILGLSMMLYMLFISLAQVHFLKKTKTVGTITAVALGAGNMACFLMPMLTNVGFYDTLPYWVVAQILASAVLFGCLVKEIGRENRQNRWILVGFLLPPIAFVLDVGMCYGALWEGGQASILTFTIFFVVSMVVVLRIIPHSINTLTRAKKLETEKNALSAQLAESRISTMMSQIRPHFIYNTLGSIEQLCSLDPKKAGELVHNFAKYLRGNFGELDNPKPILMSREMEHVRYYTSIEKVRFPDMTFSFEMRSGDFYIPALTIQPIVENAIKHGLMKREKDGTIRVVSYETDTHYCVTVEDDGVGFDTGVLLDERKHVGIRNIRERLKAMVNGTLEIDSKEGVGTKVLIAIPKEEEQ